VLAGPGTGKSSTAVALAARLALLDPRPKVRFLTFTRAATAELAEKVREAGQEATSPSTIHSFAIAVLLRNQGAAPIPEPLRIADDWEQATLIRQHLSNILDVGVRDVDNLMREMSAKWESLDPDFEDPDIPEELRNLFVGVFNDHRRVFGYTLLSELPELLRGVLRDYERVEGIDYDLMLVDEYQDLNACDLEVLRRLGDRGVSILGVGDDDQSIYSFRKAHPEGIRRFPNDYLGAALYDLTFCHRLNARIGVWAQFVMAGDVSRTPRAPLTYADDAPEGHVALLGFRSTADEAQGVARLVRWLVEHERIDPNDIGILFRGDYQSRFSRPIREQLEVMGIPVVDSQRAKRLMEEADTRRLLAILQLLVNPTDSLAWWSLMHLQPGIGSAAVDYIFGLAHQGGTTFGRAMATNAPDFQALNRSLSARMEKLWRETTAMVDQLAPDLPEKSDGWGAILSGLVTVGRLPSCSDELLAAIVETDKEDDEIPFAEFVARFGLRLREQVEADQTGVRCMTMAASKGLTMRACVVVGVEDDLIPRPGEDLNEERRLLYVAMTRAREHLVLTWVERRQGPAARSGRTNVGRRHASDLLRGGPVESQRGADFIANL
jgi:DNA helicase-2/ATP-dependent DNA helicase PcrA